MAQKKLSVMKIKSIKGGGRWMIYGDGEGLFLRVSPIGAKSWIFIYEKNKKQHRMSLGSYPAVTLESARTEAGKCRTLLSGGKDPIAERENEEYLKKKYIEITKDNPVTVRGLFAKWENAFLAHEHKDGGSYVENVLQKHAFPIIGETRLVDIDILKHEISRILLRIKDDGKNRTHNVVLANLRQMFMFGMEHNWVASNPTGLAKSTSKITDRRILSANEIKMLPNAFKVSLSEKMQLALWIQFSLICRSGELMAAEWRHVDIPGKTIFFPKENRKAIRASGGQVVQVDHWAYLSDFCIKKLEELQGITGDTRWLFPSHQKDKDGPVIKSSIGKMIGDRQLTPEEIEKTIADEDARGIKNKRTRDGSLILPGGKWRPHDLRRTGSTIMQKLGVSEAVVQKCLSHIEPDKVKAAYLCWDYEPQSRDAWIKLGSTLRELTLPCGNVETELGSLDDLDHQGD